MDWDDVPMCLKRWHEQGDRGAAREALAFLEAELRRRVPSVLRTWPEDLREDALRTFLLKLLEKPLDSNIENPFGFFSKSFTNYCIDLHRAYQRRGEQPLDSLSSHLVLEADREPSPFTKTSRRELAQRVQTALGEMKISDRVVLKLVLGPEWMDDSELSWLAERSGRSLVQVRAEIIAAPDNYALSRIFDPGDDDPDDPDVRRKRMERFRRRGDRAQEKLHMLLEGVV